MKKIIVSLKLEMRDYEDEDVFELSAESLGEMVFQSDICLPDLDIESWRVEEQHG
tara:strand:+ start:20210 stop:20374 length:165 start_codon:yes stop_codon:yes gene_type:complete